MQSQCRADPERASQGRSEPYGPLSAYGNDAVRNAVRVLMAAAFTGMLSGPLAAQAHPGLDEGERAQRRMELRRHLMQERERWLAEQGADDGLPLHRRLELRRHLMQERERWRALQGLAPMPREAGDGAVSPSAGESSSRAPDLSAERLSADERRALRRAINQAYPGNVGASVP